MRTELVTCATVCFTCLLFAAVPETDGSGNLVFDIPSGTHTYTEALNHNGGLIKRGAGRLDLSAQSAAWKGEITVEAGILGSTGGGANRFGQNAYGTSDPLTVMPGATLAPSDSADDYSLRTRQVHISGTGVGGMGAISYSGGQADALFKDVTLEGDATVNAQGRFGFNGTLYMKGHTLTKIGAGVFSLAGENITDTPGNIVVKEGTLFIQNSETRIGGTSANFLDVQAGTLSMWSMNTAENPVPWTLFMTNSAALTVRGSSSYWSGPVFIRNWLTPTIDKDATLSLSGPVTANGLAAGEGTLVFGGSVTNKGDLYGTRGEFVINGPGPHKLASVTLWNKGCLSMEGAGRVDIQGNTLVRGKDTASLTVSGDTVVDTSGFYVAGDETSAETSENPYVKYGKVTLADGAVMTNSRFSVGMFGGRGGFVVTNAFHYWKADERAWSYIGGATGSYGYYAVNAGAAFWNGRTWIASGVDQETNGGDGMLVQRGGSITMDSWSATVGGYGRGEHAVLDGAKFTMHYSSSGESSYYIGKSDKTDAAGRGVLTISGAGSELRVPDKVYCGAAGGFTALLNINAGGALAAKRLRFRDAVWAIDAKAFHVGLNGGIIRPTQSWGFSESKPPTSVTVYDGGMIYDTSECSAEPSLFQASLSGPTGKGIASITLPEGEEFAAERYVGPPAVTITGSGTAASALVDFDDATSTPKGVIITSPGFDYGDDTVVTVASADGKSSYVCAVTMFDHTASGGFTKLGAGEVRLTKPSTYGGPTVISAGKVLFEHEASLPSSTDLTVAESAIADLDGSSGTVASLGGIGTVKGDLTVTGDIHVRCADVFNGGRLTVDGKLTLNGGRIVIDDPENVAMYMNAGKAAFISTRETVGEPAEIVAADGSGLSGVLFVKKTETMMYLGFKKGLRVIIR